MKSNQRPRLRTANKTEPPYPLNDFGPDFPLNLGREIVYLLTTKGKGVLQGSEWEEIFAKCIGADWRPSNIGLDDVVLGNTAWGAKTVKSAKQDFKELRTVRLISGRNSIVYSFGSTVDTGADANEVGEQVLKIWNERVTSVREKFKNLRTVVLVKSEDLSRLAVFEYDTIRYEPDLYDFSWNKNENLEGFERGTNIKKFVWQPHGSQFTIIEQVPENSLVLNIKQPESLDKEVVLESLGFDENWVQVVS